MTVSPVQVFEGKYTDFFVAPQVVAKQAELHVEYSWC